MGLNKQINKPVYTSNPKDFLSTVHTMKNPNKKIKKSFLLIAALMFFCTSNVYAEKGAEKTKETTETNQTEVQELSQQFAELQASITGSIEQESTNLGEVTRTIADEKLAIDKIDKEIGVYKILISSAQNLLLIPDADIDILEKNSEELNLTQTELEEKLTNIKTNSTANTKNIESTEEKIDISQKQIDSIKKEYGKDKDIKPVLKSIEELNKIRADKLKAMKQLGEIYEKQLRMMNSVVEPYSDLAGKVEEKLRLRQQEVLFERNHNIITQLKPDVLYKDFKAISIFCSNFFSKDFWRHKFSKATSSDIYSLIIHISGLVAGFFFLRAIKKHLKLDQRISDDSKLSNVKNILFFFDKALVLGALTGFLYIYEYYKEYTGIYSFLLPFKTACAAVLIIYLFSSALEIYLKQIETPASAFVLNKKTYIARFFYVFSCLYIFIEWISGSGSTILLLARLFLESAAIILFTLALKKVKKISLINEESQVPSFKAIKLIGYTITGTGLVLEIAGYGYLTIHWYKGWIITATVSSLIFFCLQALKEWDQFAKDKDVRTSESTEGSQPERHGVYPLYWLGIRVLTAIVLLIGVGTVAYICGARERVFEGAWALVTHKLEIGGTKFSISNTILAFFVILLTQAFTRIWRSMMKGRILKNSGIESGLKDSITTISSYLIWGLGLLTAMHAFGLSTTSLTVGFGALGIGLGFGLQNIFNNFISGLILLFERPIQVGDVVEINGVLGMVTKINVRSTLVQTYSNASFIIPNSEFISTRVINWSHKDPYVKRDVTIGVAYGSDTQKVRNILLAAADAVPEILNFPMAPSVSFINFGDSSLDFKVKFWTTIDDFSAAESTLRFEIEKRFRENDINIPFPQREIKIIKE